MNDRHKYILQFLWRFGASRVDDIPMRSTGGPPQPGEIQSLFEMGFIERMRLRDVRQRDLPDTNGAYWQLTEEGISKARS